MSSITPQAFDAAMNCKGQTFQGLVKQLGTQTTYLLKWVQDERPDALPKILEMQRSDIDPQCELMLRRLSGMRRAANKCKLDPKAMASRNLAILIVAYCRHEVGGLAMPPGWVPAMQHVLIERGCPVPTTGSIRTLRVRLLDFVRSGDNRWRLPQDQFDWLTSQL